MSRPEQILARLHALADQWDTDRADFDRQARAWHEKGNELLKGTSSGRVRQLADCAADLRNLANDLLPKQVVTVELPPGLPLINANKRIFRYQLNEMTQAIREAAKLLAGPVPAMKRAHIVCEIRPPDRRRRDVHNLYPSAKAAVDGLVDAGVLPDDSDRYLIGPDMRAGDVEPGGRLVLHITELEAR